MIRRLRDIRDNAQVSAPCLDNFFCERCAGQFPCPDSNLIAIMTAGKLVEMIVCEACAEVEMKNVRRPGDFSMRPAVADDFARLRVTRL